MNEKFLVMLNKLSLLEKASSTKNINLVEEEEQVQLQPQQSALLASSLALLLHLVVMVTLVLQQSQSTTHPKTIEQKSSLGMPLQESSKSSTEQEHSILAK